MPKVKGTHLEWHTLSEWAVLIEHYMVHYNFSKHSKSRMLALAGSLRFEEIHTSYDIKGLRRIDPILKKASRFKSEGGNGIERHLKKQYIVKMLVETRSRITVLQLPRLGYKIKNPRFHMPSIPDDVLDGLIQRHPDMKLVEKLRTESKRRQDSSINTPPPYKYMRTFVLDWSDERRLGNGIIISLNKGYAFQPSECELAALHVMGFDTVREASDEIKTGVHKCSCQWCMS
ncbi:MAG: hypothetical protein COA43_00490 [Robiginitomaculum sp.]|nr:MAG: hypothetical protein COA43_00490 [Robiginitomaculum sp.]